MESLDVLLHHGSRAVFVNQSRNHADHNLFDLLKANNFSVQAIEMDYLGITEMSAFQIKKT